MKKLILTNVFLLLFSQNIFAKTVSNYEIRTAPIALLARWVTLDFAFNLDNQWAIGPSVIIYAAPKIGNMFIPTYNGYAAGVNVYGYLNSFSTNGWYWGNHLYYENFESYPHDFLGHYELSGFKFNTVGGYQVVTNFNLI